MLFGVVLYPELLAQKGFQFFWGCAAGGVVAPRARSLRHGKKVVS